MICIRLSRCALAVGVLFFATASSCGPVHDRQNVSANETWLFTEDDAVQLRVSAEDWLILERPRGISLGPRIVIEQPSMVLLPDGPSVETASPTTFQIRFEPHPEGGAVDLESLTITARRVRMPRFKRELTDKLLRFLRGDEILAEDIKVPRGRYLVDIAIADTAGIQTVETFRLNVVEGDREGTVAEEGP